MRTTELCEVMLITSEPGDYTRYNYYIIPDTSNGYAIVPNESTFSFPTYIEDYEVKQIVDIETASEFLKYIDNQNRFDCVNPNTLLEVCNAIRECFIK